MAKNPQPAGALRSEIERRLQSGWCVYCRAPAAPDRPLTREHVVPRSRGGRRKDVGIVVPACGRCNRHRGHREFVLFLLSRPQRIATFLDYLGSLPEECLGAVDLRVIADLYAAVWLLSESAQDGAEWRQRLRRLCSGRRLHRRRYTARRVVGAVASRLDRLRRRTRTPAGPSCLIPVRTASEEPVVEPHPEVMRAALVTLLARLSEAPAEWVLRELVREQRRLSSRSSVEKVQEVDGASALASADAFAPRGTRVAAAAREEAVVSLEAWRGKRRRWRRSRVDRRRSGGARGFAA